MASESETLDELQARVRGCRRCAAAGHPVHSSAVFSGTAKARVVFIGQAPGRFEIEGLRPFSGPAGKRLFEWLARAGFDESQLREQHYFTSVTRCFPGAASSGRGDRVPSRAEQALCRGWLDGELALLDARVIVPVGRVAIQALLGRKPLDLVVGAVQRDALGREVVPLPHPSGASAWLQAPANAASLERALRHLARLRKRLAL